MSSKKQKVTIEYPKLAEHEAPADWNNIAKEVEKSEASLIKQKHDKNIKSGTLISRADFPIEIKYGNQNIRLSPRERVVVKDISKVNSSHKMVIIREDK
jgi:hypothetical protein